MDPTLSLSLDPPAHAGGTDHFSYFECRRLAAHQHGTANQAVLALRNWFVDTVHLSAADSPTVNWYRFMDFNTDFY